MNSVALSIPVSVSEAGAVLARVTLTQEANGLAVWWEPMHADPRLLAWHGFSPRRSAVIVLAEATNEARRVAREAIDHGVEYAANRRFAQQ